MMYPCLQRFIPPVSVPRYHTTGGVSLVISYEFLPQCLTALPAAHGPCLSEMDRHTASLWYGGNPVLFLHDTPVVIRLEP